MALLLALAASLVAAAPQSTPASSTSPAGSCASHETAAELPDGRVLCSHGNDPRPGSGVASGMPYAGTPGEALPSSPPQCYDDGRSGTRVQVLVVSAAGASRDVTLSSVRGWVGQVEWTFAASATRDGGQRHVRWVTAADGAGGCQVDLVEVFVPSAALNDFQATITAVADQGYDRADRKYLMFVEASAGICGFGTAPDDDQPGSANESNRTVGYGRIDTECWSTADLGYYSVPAHELAHMLGAVQQSAPHASADRHCTDEWDLMCYSDGSGVTTSVACQDDDNRSVDEGDLNNRLLDCHQDDYFDAGTASGYLTTHWNVAASVFLAATAGTGPGYSEHPEVVADPQGRPRAWSGRLGAHRPVVRDAYGWEACDLPVVLAVADGQGTARSGGLLGGGGSSGGGISTPLKDAVLAAADWVNSAVGATVVQVDASADAAQPGVAVINTDAIEPDNGTAPPTRVVINVGNARITGAVVTIDEGRATAGGRLDVWVAQALAEALGLGHDGQVGTLMASWPTPTASRTVAGKALRHLYGSGACSEDRRLDDTVAGDRTQRRGDGTRERVDLAPTATDPVGIALEVAAYERAQQGAAWADVAVVCRDDVHADCLAGSALAAQDGPVTYVPGGPNGTLPAAVANELAASMSATGTLYILGGTGSVSPGIEAALRQALPGRTVTRISGKDRFATAVRVADEVLARRAGVTGGGAGTLPVALIARSDDPVDAVSAGAYAARRRVPVLLSARTSLPAGTAAWLDAHHGTVVVVGGSASVSDDVLAEIGRRTGRAPARVSGRDRFATSVAVAEHGALWGQTSVTGGAGVVGLNGASPLTWNLALAVAPVAAVLDAPIVYVSQDAIADPVLAHLRRVRVTGTLDLATIFIGGAFVTPSVRERFHAEALPGFDGNVIIQG